MPIASDLIKGLGEFHIYALWRRISEMFIKCAPPELGIQADNLDNEVTQQLVQREPFEVEQIRRSEGLRT